MTDEFVTAEELGTEYTADLNIYFCDACRMVQTLHTMEPGKYYREYGYTVSASPLAQRFMRRLAEETFRRFGFQGSDRVLEIGSGDGFQLACFKERGARVLGFEPSGDLCRRARENGVKSVQRLFTTAETDQIPDELRPAQVVLLSYTFDHLPDPQAVLEAIKTILDPQRGVLVIEIHDLEKVLERCETCLFEHEHTIYLHSGSLRRLLESAGYTFLTTRLLPDDERRANSLLVAVAPAGSEHTPDASNHRSDSPHLDTWDCYAEFAGRVEESHKRLRQYVQGQIERGRQIAGYGAGGRGVMTLAMAGLDAASIVYLCDANPAIHGLYTPATHVPVVSPERLLEDSVDEVIVFSYGYLAEIRDQWRAFEARGGQFTSLLDVL